MSAGTELYTVIMLYSGGTYVSQVRASSVDDAVRRWAIGQDWKNITDSFSPEVLAEKVNCGEDVPQPLNGLQNVWCTGYLLPTKLATVFVVQTSEQ
jgi:hypothetical protein